MNHRIRIVWLLFLGLGFVPSVYASEAAGRFLTAIQQYQEKDYQGAASTFQQIAESGVVNGSLFYNLGNAYFKAGEIGRAILWYERALRFLPRDPDLKFNLNYARSLVKDEAGTTASPLYHVLFFWNHLLSRTSVLWGAVLCNLAFWIAFILQYLTGWRIFRFIKYSTGMIAIIFVLTAFYNYYESEFIKQAVVLPATLSVRSGLSEEDTELFRLHAGSRVRIEKEKDDFYRIFFSEGKIGWVGKSQVEAI